MKKTPLKRSSGSLARKPIKRASTGQIGANKRTLKPKKKVWKFKKTELAECDSAFSREIRERDGRCMFPGCSVEDYASLQASHYFGRANWNTRFDPDNMISLCMFHHFRSKDLGYEYQKQRKEKHGWDGQYTLFMKKLLGEERWSALLERAYGKNNRRESIIAAQKKYNLRQPLSPPPEETNENTTPLLVE